MMSARRHKTVDWVNETTAFIGELVVSTNLGITQQIIENSSENFDGFAILTNEILSLPDDFGMFPVFTAIFYDRANVIWYLHRRGVDLSQPCDTDKYGTPMFYAISLKKYEIVDLLDRIGYSVMNPCDSFGQLPIAHAIRIGDVAMVQLVEHCSRRAVAAVNMVMKHHLRRKYRRKFLEMKKCIVIIQRWIRRKLSRKGHSHRKKPSLTFIIQSTIL